MIKIACCLFASLLLTLSSDIRARGLADLPVDAVIVDPRAFSMDELAAASAAAKTAREALAEGPAAALKVLDGIEDPLRHAHAAVALIAELQEGEGDPYSRAVLKQLTMTPLRVFRRHEETAADWFLPHVDVAGRARFALRLLDARADRQRWIGAWTVDPQAALAVLKQLDASSQHPALEALAALPRDTADRVLGSALKDPARQSPALWPALAAATGDAVAFGLAARHGSDAEVLGLLAVRDRLPQAKAVGWLLALVERPSLASAALLALAEHADFGSEAWFRLIRALDEPALAPSAAAALARRPHADRVPRIIELEAGGSSNRLFAVVLALRLDGSPEAIAALGGLREDPRLPAATRAELAR